DCRAIAGMRRRSGYVCQGSGQGQTNLGLQLATFITRCKPPNGFSLGNWAVLRTVAIKPQECFNVFMSETAAPFPINFAEALEAVYKGPEGSKRVEQVVIRLLERLLSEANLPLSVIEAGSFDAVAPMGIGDLPGPTVIGITHNLRRLKGPRFLPSLKKAI